MKDRLDDFDPAEREMLAHARVANHCPPPDLLLAAQAEVLPEETATPVRTHLAACRSCRELVASLTSAEVSAPTPAERDRIRARVEAGMTPVRKPFWQRWPAWLAAAGSLAGVAAAILVMTKPQPKPLQPTPPVLARQDFRLPLGKPALKLSADAGLVWRGESSSSNQKYLPELGAALAPYRADDFAAAVPLLEALAAKYPQASEPPFYLGVSLLHVKRGRDAVAALEQTLQRNPAILRDDANWYLAVAYERQGEPQRAAGLLKPLCEREGEYRERACQAIRTLP